ncbi:MAG: hypothetical protein A4S09_13240 [Proteobacteria bacterium SG_bin7]|nr:MAG: hypothetical protein A4S09_13240 [Proteobacteria bacterium SG_bin7]
MGKDLKKILSEQEYQVTQKEGTEPAFQNKYWDNHEDGIYVDIVSGEPLFSSLDKYDSGTGWPSFTKPIDDGSVKFRKDIKLFSVRTEVRSKMGDSHLGHVFDDGPKDRGGKRFCMNSSAMRFVPVNKMKDEGYVGYLKLFEKKSKNIERAVFSAGCFWGVEEIIRNAKGVVGTRVGYTGGKTEYPTYETVKLGNTGHAEAIEVEYDASVTSYDELLTLFFRLHDPTTLNRQGNDIGTQYRSTIFFSDETQKKAANQKIASLTAKKKFTKPITTTIEKLGQFYPAEEYHQKYLQKNPGGYTCHYLRD